MVGASRCFGGIIFQLGGPDALAAVVRFLFLRARFSFTPVTRCLPEKFWAEKSLALALSRKARWPVQEWIFLAIGKSEASAHNLRGEVAARCVAFG